MKRRRSRVLSEDGKKLLCVAYEPPVFVKTKCHRLSTLFHDLFSTQYDTRLEETVHLFRNGSEALMSKLDSTDLPQCTDNAILNMLTMILRDDRKSREFRRQDVKNNIRWYLNVAHRARETKDHNTAVLLRSVLCHHAISRLQITSQRMAEKMKLLEQEYGTFMDCQKHHIETILNTKPSMFRPGKHIPSAMIVDMYQNRTKEHLKAFQSIGKMPSALIDIRQKMRQLTEILLTNFQPKKDHPLIPLYESTPELTRNEIQKLSYRIHQ